MFQTTPHRLEAMRRGLKHWPRRHRDRRRGRKKNPLVSTLKLVGLRHRRRSLVSLPSKIRRQTSRPFGHIPLCNPGTVPCTIGPRGLSRYGMCSPWRLFFPPRHSLLVRLGRLPSLDLNDANCVRHGAHVAHQFSVFLSCLN